MIPLRLACTNFGPYGRVDLDLEGLEHVCVVGENGAGKSYLADIVKVALFGIGRARAAETLRHGCNSGEVSCDLRHLSKIYRVTRKIKLAASGKARTTVDLLERTDDGWRAVDKGTVETTFGFNLQGLEATMFLRSYGAKGLGDFAAIDPGDRKELLFRLRGLQGFGKLGERAHGVVTLAGEVVTNVADKLAGLEAERQSAGEAAGRAAAMKPQLRALVDAMAARASAIEKAQAARSAADQLRRRLEEAQKRERELRDALDTIRTTKAEMETEMQGALALNAQRDEIAAAAKRRDDLRLQWHRANKAKVALDAKLPELRAAREAAQAALRDAENALEAGRRDVAAADARERAQGAVAAAERDLPAARAADNYHGVKCRTEAAVTDAREKAELLGCVPCRGIGQFAGCQFLTNAAAAAANLPGLESELAAAVAALHDTGIPGEEAARRVTALTAALAAAQGRLAAIGEPRAADLDALQAVFNQTSEAVAHAGHALDGEEAKARKLGDKLREMLVEGRKAGEIANKGAALEEVQARFDGLRLRYEELCDTTEPNAQRALSEASAAADAIAEELSRQGDVDLDGLQAAQRGAATERDTMTREIGGLEALSGRLEAIEAAIEETKTSHAAARRKLAAAGLLKRFYKEAPTLVVEHDLAAIEAAANDWLRRTSSLRVHLATQTTARTTKSVKETLSILVRDGSSPWTDRNILSGSEVFRVDLAVALAIGKVLGVGQAWLFLDEGFGTLRGATIGSVVGALEDVLPELGALWAITHVPEVAAVFPSRLTVVPGPDGSTVEILR